LAGKRAFLKIGGHYYPDMSDPVVPQDPDWLPPEINTGVPHPARVYDYWIGGVYAGMARKP
jgi:hypothetical protein